MYKIKNYFSDKKKYYSGSFYTPDELALRIAKYIKPSKESKIIDPCVGSANLFKAIKKLYPEIPNENFYGVDIDLDILTQNINDPELKGMHFQFGDCLKDDITNDLFWEKPYNISFSDFIKPNLKVLYKH